MRMTRQPSSVVMATLSGCTRSTWTGSRVDAAAGNDRFGGWGERWYTATAALRPTKAVQKQLGHATASITLDTYGHLFPDELDQLAERLEDVRARALAARQAAEVSPRSPPAAQRCRQMTSNAGAGGGARTLMPVRARRF